jgi:hypothetical protein
VCACLGSLCAESAEDWIGNTYTALEVADEKALEDLAGLVAVADVFEGFGWVLAADVEEDFLTTGVLVYEAWGAQEWLAVGFWWDRVGVCAGIIGSWWEYRRDILVQS